MLQTQRLTKLMEYTVYGPPRFGRVRPDDCNKSGHFKVGM